MEYIKPEVEIISFETEVVTNTGTTLGEDDVIG